jgi:hypothetical protein
MRMEKVKLAQFFVFCPYTTIRIGAIGAGARAGSRYGSGPTKIMRLLTDSSLHYIRVQKIPKHVFLFLGV